MPVSLIPTLKLIVIIALITGAYFAGRNDVQTKWDLEVAKAEKKEADFKNTTLEATQKVEIKYIDRINTVKVKGDTIVKEVTKYVTTTDNAQCIIPAGFVRMHNDAVENIVSDSAGSVNETTGKTEKPAN